MTVRNKLTIASAVGVQAGPVAPEPDERDQSDRSDFASTLASKPDTRAPGRPAVLSQPQPAPAPAIQATDLLAGMPDPDQDLVNRAWRVPRYVAQTVELVARLTRRSQQDIVADILRDQLDSDQLDMVRRALYGER